MKRPDPITTSFTSKDVGAGLLALFGQIPRIIFDAVGTALEPEHKLGLQKSLKTATGEDESSK